ncbi:hypothetical protein LY78DRAFT_212557 [Colletotrichum sublineola]|nr:hypothetical protein LY78DRAFT_212557 [Colletotrichum sublineola]
MPSLSLSLSLIHRPSQVHRRRDHFSFLMRTLLQRRCAGFLGSLPTRHDEQARQRRVPSLPITAGCGRPNRVVGTWYIHLRGLLVSSWLLVRRFGLGYKASLRSQHATGKQRKREPDRETQRHRKRKRWDAAGANTHSTYGKHTSTYTSNTVHQAIHQSISTLLAYLATGSPYVGSAQPKPDEPTSPNQDRGPPPSTQPT